MYDCGKQLEIKVEVLKRLGFDEDLLKLYLPGSAPSQISNNQNALHKLYDTINIWKYKGIYNLNDYFTSTLNCPYCIRKPLGIKNPCIKCKYKIKFGDYSAKRFLKIKNFITSYELDPSTEQFKSALEYLQSQIKDY